MKLRSTLSRAPNSNGADCRQSIYADVEKTIMNAIPADRCKMPQAFWRAFAEAGVKPAAILRHARLPATLHLNPNVLLSTAQIFAIYNAVEELVDDPGFAIKLVGAFDRSGHQPAFLAVLIATEN